MSAQFLKLHSVVACALLLSACSSEPTSSTDASGFSCGPMTDAGPTESFATFNAGLARNFVGYASERVQPVAAALAGVDADFLCVEEVWEDGDVAVVTEAAKAKFPYQYQVPTAAESTAGLPPSCTPTDAAPLKACVEAHCANAPTLAECALAECSKEYLATSNSCQTCLAANIYLNSIGSIFAACAQSSSQFIFGGRNGLILLSKKPLKQLEYKKLDSYLIQRVILHAVATASDVETHLFCTHIQAGLGDIAYNGKAGSWEAEQGDQLKTLAAWILERSVGGPWVLMGDLNAGPDRPPELTGEFPKNFDLLIDGLNVARSVVAMPFTYAASPVCSWCDANLLTATTPNEIIDHIVLSQQFSGLAGQRILDQPLTLPGGATQVNLSDHYGVRITAKRSALGCK